jgi:hypothetical protein
MKQTLIIKNLSDHASEESKQTATSNVFIADGDASCIAEATNGDVVIVPPVFPSGNQGHCKFQHCSLSGSSQEEDEDDNTPHPISIQKGAETIRTISNEPDDGSVFASVATPTKITSSSRYSSSKRSASFTTTVSAASTNESTSTATSTRFRFPDKLHQLLEQCSDDPNESRIVSWVGDRAFKVHEPKQFASDILPRYFSTTTYKSFQRNLNLW